MSECRSDQTYAVQYSYLINILTCDDDVDIDECSVKKDNCSTFATCTNVPGSFTCACLPGFTGDGFNCTGKSDSSSVVL